MAAHSRPSGVAEVVLKGEPGSTNAARQLRTSPGGRTPNSRRSRPELPPSSVTVTTAVMRVAASVPAIVGLGAQPFEHRREAGSAADSDDPRRRRALLARRADDAIAAARGAERLEDVDCGADS